MNERKRSLPTTLLSVALAIAILLLVCGGILLFSIFRLIPADTLLQLSAVRYLIHQNYIFDYDEEVLSDKLISGMVEGLGDPYSVYRTEEEQEDFLYRAMGEFGGIGVVVSLDESGEKVYVMEVYPASPAESGGVLAGDCILAIDGEAVTDELEETAAKIRGKVGSKVTLTLYRESEDRTFEQEFKREEIEAKTVESKMLSDTIGYLRISAFNHGTAEDMIAAVKTLEDDGADALVLDLRDNSGGSVDAAEKMADYFLDEGVLYSVIRKDDKETVIKSDADYDPIPLVILVNDGSASASELFSGALKDRNRAKLVGETTFGKGIMQNQFKVLNGYLTLTFAEYATPNGTRIHKIGITPDVVVSLSEESRYRWPTLSLEEDIQLQEAIKLLKP